MSFVTRSICPSYSPIAPGWCRARLLHPNWPTPRTAYVGNTTRVKTLSVALAVLGLLLGTLLVGWFGAGRVLAGVLSVGWGGFAIVLGWQLVLFVIIGLAWDAIAPRRE